MHEDMPDTETLIWVGVLSVIAVAGVIGVITLFNLVF